MKRRDFLGGLAIAAAGPTLLSCSDQSARGADSVYTVELWADSDPDDFANSKAVRLAAATLIEHHKHKGLYSLLQPLVAKLSSGLTIEVTCERVATGHLNCGVTHDGKLASLGKYAGQFTLRVFPPEHQSYVLDVKAGDVAAAGA